MAGVLLEWRICLTAVWSFSSKVALDTQLSSCVSVLSRAPCLASSLMLDDMSSCSRGGWNLLSVLHSKTSCWMDCVQSHCMASLFWIQYASVDMDRSFQWLRQSLHSESESMLFTIQDQVICTRVYQTKIMGSQVCHLYNEQEENDSTHPGGLFCASPYLLSQSPQFSG